ILSRTLFGRSADVVEPPDDHRERRRQRAEKHDHIDIAERAHLPAGVHQLVRNAEGGDHGKREKQPVPELRLAGAAGEIDIVGETRPDRSEEAHDPVLRVLVQDAWAKATPASSRGVRERPYGTPASDSFREMWCSRLARATPGSAASRSQTLRAACASSPTT